MKKNANKQRPKVSSTVKDVCCNIDSFGEICVHCGLCKMPVNLLNAGEQIMILKARRYIHNNI